MPLIPDLCGFLGASSASGKCQLLLPHYKGTAQLDTNGTTAPSLSYRGSTFAERDSRAAFYVQSLLRQVFDADDIEIRPAVARQVISPTAFLFGSRSNVVTQNILQPPRTSLFRFEFGADWKIHCEGKVFSIPDPSVLPPSVYHNIEDYGVIARLGFSRDPGAAATSVGSVFIIAGLGGRATEGCGYFFLRNWNDLFKKFGRSDFAVVLKFPSPFALERSEYAATAQA